MVRGDDYGELLVVSSARAHRPNLLYPAAGDDNLSALLRTELAQVFEKPGMRWSPGLEPGSRGRPGLLGSHDAGSSLQSPEIGGWERKFPALYFASLPERLGEPHRDSCWVSERCYCKGRHHTTRRQYVCDGGCMGVVAVCEWCGLFTRKFPR